MKQSKPLIETGVLSVNGAPVSFVMERSRKRKRTIAFKLEADASLHIIVPYAASLRQVTHMMQAHAPWVSRKLAQRHALPPHYRANACRFENGDTVPYIGHLCRLHISSGEGQVASCRLKPHAFYIHVPDEALSPEGLRDEARFEMVLWYKKRARKFLLRRLDLWAQRMELTYKKFILADPDRRWGSCSANNIVRLNWRLMLAPLAVIDYVVVHELCHVRHKDHSQRFWGLLEQYIPDWRHHRRQLRQLEQSSIIEII